MLTLDEAVRFLRVDRLHADRMRASYLDEDPRAAAERFEASGEFTETCKLLGPLCDKIIVDLGAGTGIASYAFARAGAKLVYAVEPDHSELVGRGAIARVTQACPVEILSAFGEEIPLPPGRVDVVYVRQVLHHARNLHQLLNDCARVLKPGGVFFACREHVVDNEQQLTDFLRTHPVHQLVGNENAYPLAVYLDAIRSAGLVLENVFGPWDTVINAFPSVNSPDELRAYPATLLKSRFGKLGEMLGNFSAVQQIVWRRLKRPVPGRLFAFLAHKP